MAVDYFDGWGKERAIELLDSWPRSAVQPAKRGVRKGNHLKYSASYEVGRFGPRHIAVLLRGQKRGVEIWVNNLSSNGSAYLEADFPRVEVLDRKPAGFEGMDGNPGIGSGVNRNSGLKPRHNDVLHLYVRDELAFVELLKWYSGDSPSAPVPSAVVAPPTPVNTSQETEAETPLAPPAEAPKEGLSLKALLLRLNENAETGERGEQIALDAERRRLQEAGCPDPAQHVRHVAPVDVSAGFDIESRWNGEVRCIEVKSSRGDGIDFFMSENERSTLKKLGAQAWLYRVAVESDGSGNVVEMIPDPINALAAETFEPVVWRVRRDKLT